MTSLAEALNRASRRLAADPAGAEAEAAAILAIAGSDPRARLLLGCAKRRMGEAEAAIPILADLAREQPAAFHVHFELGLARTAAGELAAAREDLRRALALRPSAREAWFALWDADPEDEADSRSGPEDLRAAFARHLFDDQRIARATRWARALADERPDSIDDAGLLAACLASGGAFEDAIVVYERILGAHPDRARLWLGYGHALRALGRREDCIAAYHRAIALEPAFGEPYWALANLKLDGGLDPATLRSQLSRADASAEDSVHFHYALGKALEDEGAEADAFASYAEGARLMRARLPYSAEAVNDQVSRSVALFSRAFYAERAGWGSPAEGPIFVVGLPRSGSTLVEQILASHPLVEGAGELPVLPRIAERMTGAGAYPDRVAALSREQVRAIGEAYLEGARDWRRTDRPLFVDKLPQNFHHLGLIRLAVPGARIVDARRAPMAAGWAAFKQLFARGHAFSYDLRDIGLYHRDYRRLMDHFDRVSPGAVHRVELERLVDDLEAAVASLLAACGLDFHPACLAFHENPRPVRTPSSEQVRQPIYREGLQAWRRFEPWLRPLADALD